MKSSSQMVCWTSRSASQQFRWVRVHRRAVRSSRLLRSKMNIKVCASVTTAPCLFHPHTSLIRLAASHHIHLLVSPSPLSNHPLCSKPRSQPSLFLIYFFALLFFSACFSCCLVCRPCFIWFSLSVIHHSIRTATVGDKLSTSSLILPDYFYVSLQWCEGSLWQIKSALNGAKMYKGRTCVNVP